MRSTVLSIASPFLVVGLAASSPTVHDRGSNDLSNSCIVRSESSDTPPILRVGDEYRLPVDELGSKVLIPPSCLPGMKSIYLGDGDSALGVSIPEPGTSISIEALKRQESTGPHSLHVKALGDGTLELSTDDLSARIGTSEPSVPGDALSTQSLACSDKSFNWSGELESGIHEWLFNTSAMPSYLNATTVENDLKAGMEAWEHTPNTDCTSAPMNRIRQTYMGRTSLPTNTTSNACQSSDGHSVWKFNHISDPTTLAFTCRWASGGEIKEADVRWASNPTGWVWGNTVNQCASQTADKYMVSDVSTHEAGHVFGFLHVPQYSEQTMGPYTDVCSKAHTTLGRGDMLGAASVYPW